MKVIPTGTRPKSMKLMLSIQTGMCKGYDEDFRICIKDGNSQVKKWTIGHVDQQNAWSYSCEEFDFPVNESRILEISTGRKM